MDNTPKAFLFVGHENWGKSDTLEALEKRLPLFRRATKGKIVRIMNRDFFMSRMSNDDRPDEYIRILTSLNPLNQPYLILAFCPHFSDKPSKRARKALDTLRTKGYALYFWVLETKQGKGIGQHVEKIEPIDIEELEKLGTVEKFSGNALPRFRATKFQAFVESHI